MKSDVEGDQRRKNVTSHRPPEAPLSIASVDVEKSGSICRLSPESTDSAFLTTISLDGLIWIPLHPQLISLPLRERLAYTISGCRAVEITES